MTLVIETFNSASIGLSKLHFAKMINKGSASAYPSYEGYERIDGLVSGAITPNADVASDYADNRTHEQAINYAAADISLEVTGLGPAGYEYTTGRVVSQDGGSVMMAGQAAPNLATAFEVLNAQRKRVRYVVYDCIFPEGEIALQTKGDGIEFSHVPLEGQIAELLYEGKITKAGGGGEIDADGIRFMTMTEFPSADFDQTKWDNWFTTVQFPTLGGATLAANFDELLFEAGSGVGVTDITVDGTSSSAEKYAYVLGERNRPNAGAVVTGVDPVSTGGPISGVTAGMVISVYGLDSDDKVVAFGTHVMLSSEIGTT